MFMAARHIFGKKFERNEEIYVEKKAQRRKQNFQIIHLSETIFDIEP